MSAIARCCLLAVACVATTAWADEAKKIYRCGQTYQQVPCVDGQAVDAKDPRSAEQRQDARAAAAADRKQAQQLAAERQQRDKAPALQQSPMGTSMKSAESAASAPEPGAPKQHTKKHKKKLPEPDRYVPPKPPSGS